MHNPPTPGRIAALDGIRAIAVLLVVIAHSGIDWLVPGGFGVTVFFFLSGYLITTLMREEVAETGTVDLTAFYLRRGLRIFPPLYLTLVLCALLWATGVFGAVAKPDPFTVFSQFAFFFNYTQLFGDLPSLPAPGIWSLAIEEHYYLVFPLLYLLLLRKLPRNAQAGACLLLCALPLLFRIVNVATLTDYSGNYHWTHTRIDSILLGACLALANNPALDADAWRPRSWQAGAAIALILLTFAIRSPVFRETIRYTLQGGALYVLFSYAVGDDGRLSRLLASPPARLVARYSYAIYLGHLPILFALEGSGVRSAWVRAPIALLLAFGYAAVLYRWVERPLGRWRARLHPRDRASTRHDARPHSVASAHAAP